MDSDATSAETITVIGDRDIPVNGLAVSPDGQWVAFMRGTMMAAATHRSEIWKIRLDGTDLTCLTPDNDANNGWPSFSSDGTWLAFQSARSGSFDIYRMQADGSDVRRLTADTAANKTPAVSPSGRHIAFASDRDNSEARLFDIYVLELDEDGTPGTTRRLTANGLQNGHPGFSPDGAWVVYTSEAAGLCDEEPQAQAFTFAVQMYGDIYAHHLATDAVVRVTHNKWENGNPAWTRLVERG
jgi:Tol biopolymer transport system component